MAIPPKSTTLPDDLNVRTQGVTSSNASTHSRISLDQNASGETTKIAPLEIEGTNVTDAEYPTGIKFWLILMAAFLSLILVGLDISILSTAVPAITTHFKTIEDIGWYYSSYRLTSCSFQFMFGKLYSIFPLKTVFLISVAIFEIGSLISGTAVASAMLILGRAISGFGTAGIIAGCFTMMTQSVPVRQRPVIGGIAAGIEGISATAGPLLGGILTDRLSWRWCFYINVPLGFIALVLIAIFFENPRTSTFASLTWKEKASRLDLLGTAVFVPSITSLLLALQWGGSKYGWGDVRIVVLLCLSLTLLVAFGFQQWRKADDATLPPRVFGSRSLLSGFWFSFCNSSALSIVDYYMPIYFQVVNSASATKSGALCLPTVIGLFISVVLGGSGTSILGYYVPFMIGSSILMPIAAGLLTTLTTRTSLAPLIAYQFLLGFGCGLGFQGPQTAASTVFSQVDAPLAIAAVIFAQNFGPALTVPVAQSIFEGRLRTYLEKYAKGVDGSALAGMGLLDLKSLVGEKELGEALLGYDEAVTRTLFLPLALTCASLIGALGMEWRSVKVKKP